MVAGYKSFGRQWITQPPLVSRLFAKMDYKHGAGGSTGTSSL